MSNNERDRAIVLDFGLAKRVRWEERSAEEALTLSQITTTSALIGTTPYMSPEQVRGGPPDARSDIFAFSTLLYELLIGQKPFRGTTDIEILHAILYDEPGPMSALVPNVDFELKRIVRKALRKDPADRYQTISEMKKDLAAFGREKGLVWLAPTDEIRIQDLPEPFLTLPRTLDVEKNPFRTFLRTPPVDREDLERRRRAILRIARTYIGQLEDALIRHTLERTGGNIAEAARLSGLHRSTFYQRERRLSCATPSSDSECASSESA